MKRLVWSHDTLQDVKPYIIDKPYNEEHMDPRVVRQATPPSTRSEGARVQKESTLTIQ
jgi:hypothetical protein